MSVCLSVCHMPVLSLNGYRYPQFFHHRELVWHIGLLSCVKAEEACTLSKAEIILKNKNYVLSNSESVRLSHAFFNFCSRDVHPVQNLLLCTKFHENRMIFTVRSVCIVRTMPCQDVCLSVHPSHAGIVCKWLHIYSKFFHHRVAPLFEFSHTKQMAILRRGPH